MRTPAPLFALAVLPALLGCGEPTGPPSEPDELGPTEIRVQGRIEAASTLISWPVKLGVWSAQDQTGESTVLVSTMSNDRGNYSMRATTDSATCAGSFTVIVYDPFDRYIGIPVNGCGDYTFHFNIGVIPPT